MKSKLKRDEEQLIVIKGQLTVSKGQLTVK